MTTVQVNTGVRYETERGLGEYDPDVTREIPIVEVVLGGVRFTTDAATPEAARELVVRVAQALGLELPCTCEGCVSPALACRCHGSATIELQATRPPRTCALCGRPENDHNVRHMFRPVGGDHAISARAFVPLEVNERNVGIQPPPTCGRCGRRRSASMGCPDLCCCQVCHRGKCKPGVCPTTKECTCPHGDAREPDHDRACPAWRGRV